ncbi:MAG: hypothetical protein HYV06_07505 [Deltaproteobacteria bacterium]|nr:hypothetical protein [Deltaproteobacteria bacterium]
MACKALKRITVTVLDQEHIRKDWFFDFDGEPFKRLFDGMVKEMRKLGVSLSRVHNRDVTIKVNSYADLLNAVRVSSPGDGHNNQCVGHIIGQSEHLDIMEDIRTAVLRIAFAPETIAPVNEFRRVCHNCGCGC